VGKVGLVHVPKCPVCTYVQHTFSCTSFSQTALGGVWSSSSLTRSCTLCQASCACALSVCLVHQHVLQLCSSLTTLPCSTIVAREPDTVIHVAGVSSVLLQLLNQQGWAALEVNYDRRSPVLLHSKPVLLRSRPVLLRNQLDKIIRNQASATLLPTRLTAL
jgi:hypothetical protein